MNTRAEPAICRLELVIRLCLGRTKSSAGVELPRYGLRRQAPSDSITLHHRIYFAPPPPRRLRHVVQPILLHQGYPSEGLDIANALCTLHHCPCLVPSLHVCPCRGGWHKLHGSRRRQNRAGSGIARVVNPLGVIRPIGGILVIAQGHVVTLDIRDLVLRPYPNRCKRPGVRTGPGFNPRVGCIAILDGQTRLGLDGKRFRAAARYCVGRDFAETLDLGAVFAVRCTVRATHQDQPLPVHAEAVIGIEVHPSHFSVLRPGTGAAGDGRQSSDAPAHAQHAVAALAVVDECELGGHARHTRGHLDGDAVGGRSTGGDGELARGAARHGDGGLGLGGESEEGQNQDKTRKPQGAFDVHEWTHLCPLGLCLLWLSAGRVKHRG